MVAHSAGLLVFRGDEESGGCEVFLVHPGGPFWARKDAGAWSIPKGEHGPDEDPLAAARREFGEETGQRSPAGPVLDLGEVRQRGGKVVRAYAVRGVVDAAADADNHTVNQHIRRTPQRPPQRLAHKNAQHTSSLDRGSKTPARDLNLW